MTALEGVLAWLPVVLALSANSPFLAGDETGLASSRAEVLAQLPRASAPPVFGSYGEWEAFVGLPGVPACLKTGTSETFRGEALWGAW